MTQNKLLCDVSSISQSYQHLIINTRDVPPHRLVVIAHIRNVTVHVTDTRR